jgi:hypothetical protein
MSIRHTMFYFAHMIIGGDHKMTYMFCENLSRVDYITPSTIKTGIYPPPKKNFVRRFNDPLWWFYTVVFPCWRAEVAKRWWHGLTDTWDPLASGHPPFFYVRSMPHTSSLLAVVPHRCMSCGPHQGEEASEEGEIKKGEKELGAAWVRH